MIGAKTEAMRKIFAALVCCVFLGVPGLNATPAAGVSRGGVGPLPVATIRDSKATVRLPALEESVSGVSVSALRGLRDFLYWSTGHPVKVTRKFDPPAQKWLAGHRGIDLRVTAGETVYAATDAVVLYAGELAGRPLVSLEDSTGRRYTYEPVEPCVAVDDEVSRGDPIGTALGGHCAGGNCLHFGVKDGPEGYVDPLRLLGGRIRLFPTG